jgi:glutamate synthase domain-containing protein 3
MTRGTVAVLGPTGRNFAAGMSGGVAFVLNEAGRFAELCNLEMVDLEEVEAEEDKAILRRMLVDHYRHTGSKNAERVLAAWDEMLPRFEKVMPREFKRVLAERAVRDTVEAV